MYKCLGDTWSYNYSQECEGFDVKIRDNLRPSKNLDMTYVTGLWVVENNVKHSYTEYLSLIEKTLSILENCNIVFFYNKSSVLEDILPFVKTKNILFIERPINKLKTYISEQYINSCNKIGKNLLPYTGNEKGNVHYNRELLGTGRDGFRKIFTVWTSKLFILEEIMNLNPYNTSNFCWIDSGISKFKQNYGKLIPENNIIPNKLNYMENTTMKMYGKKLPINARFLQTSSSFIKSFNKLYMDYLIKNKDDEYCHDEETILALMHNDHPELFNNLDN
jgi:hypothetical protein